MFGRFDAPMCCQHHSVINQHTVMPYLVHNPPCDLTQNTASLLPSFGIRRFQKDVAFENQDKS